jgi:hypothetical protein
MYPPHVIASAYKHRRSDINLKYSSQEANSPSELLFTQPIKISSTGDTSALISPHSPGVLVRSTITEDATLCGVWQLDHSDEDIDKGPAASLKINPPSKGEGHTQDSIYRASPPDPQRYSSIISRQVSPSTCVPSEDSLHTSAKLRRQIFVPVTIFRHLLESLASRVIDQNKQLMTR